MLGRQTVAQPHGQFERLLVVHFFEGSTHAQHYIITDGECLLLSDKLLVTTAKLLAGCHAPVLNAPTMLLVVGLGVAAPHPLRVAGSKQYELAGYSLSRSFRTEPPAHTHGSSPASAGATPLPFAPPGAASSCP